MVKGGVACVNCLDEIGEGGEQYFVVDGTVKDDDEVVFIGGYATEVNRTTMSCPLGVGIEATNVIPRCISSPGARLRFREECTT